MGVKDSVRGSVGMGCDGGNAHAYLKDKAFFRETSGRFC